MRLLLSLVAALAVLSVAAVPAQACSCVGGDPRDRLSAARAAFVGTVTEERGRSGDRAYRLTVEKTYKGTLPPTLEVSSDDRSSCALDLAVGRRVGLLLRHAGPRHDVGLCDLIAPDELEAATRPYPSGSGTGTARLLVAGTFHDAGLAALDGRGRLLGWVFETPGDVAGACPGGRFAVLAGDDAAIVRLRDLSVVARHGLPDEATSAVRCLSRSGDSIVATTFAHGARSERRRLVTLTDGRARSFGARDIASLALGDRSAYAAFVGPRSYRLVAVDHATGRHRTLLTRDGWAGALALSPDGRKLAFVSSSRRHSGYRLSVIAADGSRLRTRALDRSRAPLWLSNRRLAVPADGRPGDSFDAGLRHRARVASWSTDSAVALDGRVWWLQAATGLRGRALRDPRSPRVTIDYLAGARGLATIPGGAKVSGAARREPGADALAAAATTPCGSPTSQ